MVGTRHTTARKKKYACSRKRRYVYRWQAERAVAARIEQGAAEGRNTAYFCRFCGGHHVGTTPAGKHDSRR